MNRQSNTTAKTPLITIGKTTVWPLSHSSRRQSSSWVNRIVSGVVFTGLSLSLLTSGKAEAVSFTFEKIIDTNTPIPGGTGNFSDFSGPSLDNGNVAFVGSSDRDEDYGFYGQQGIYTSIDSELKVVADLNTPAPDSPQGTFPRFGSPSLNNEDVAFAVDNNSLPGYAFPKAIYTSVDSKLNVIADDFSTPIPGGTGNFDFLGGNPVLDNGSVVFAGYDESYEQGGIYTSIDGKLDVIADRDTPVPSSNDTFEFGGAGTATTSFPLDIDNGNVAFLDEGKTSYSGEEPPPYEDRRRGIYTSIDGELKVVADTNTPIPGGRGSFIAFGELSLDNRNVAFRGFGGVFGEERSQSGIYQSSDGELIVIADKNTPIPDGTGTFEYFGSLSLDNENIAFVGGTSNEDSLANPIVYSDGIYTNLGGRLAEVIADGDLLDGKRISDVGYGLGDLSGNQVAFTAVFEDDSQGIYIATVPEPASVLGTLAFSGFGTGWLLKRRQKNNHNVVTCAKNIKLKA